MGIHDRDYYRDDRATGPLLGERMTICVWFIGAFVLVFFLQVSTREQFGPRQWEPGSFTQALSLNVEKVKRGEVWRLITYAFLHDATRPYSLVPVALTVILLFWIGRHLEDSDGSLEFAAYCLFGALLGGLSYFLVAVLFNESGLNHVGPSGMITAVLLLYAIRFPKEIVMLFFLIPIPVWFLPILWMLIDVLGVPGGQADLWLLAAHLSGICLATVYFMRKGKLIRFESPFAALRRSPRMKNSPHLRIFPSETTETAKHVPATPAEHAETRSRETADVPVGVTAVAPMVMDEHLEAQMDAILEKMNLHGKESVTEEEWAILHRASEICQKRRQKMG